MFGQARRLSCRLASQSFQIADRRPVAASWSWCATPKRNGDRAFGSTEEGSRVVPPQHSPGTFEGLGVTGKTIVYKGAGMRVLRVLVRFKVAQLAAVGATGGLLFVTAQQAHASPLHTLAAGGLFVGAVAASGALWFMSRRYVGELALVAPDHSGGPPKLVVSAMDFWGNREVGCCQVSRSWLVGRHCL